MKRLIPILDLALFYLKEVLFSNLKVAADILTPQHLMEPAMLRIDASGLSNRQLCAANNLITMTPGTLCADYDPETQELIIHAMYAGSNPSEQEDLIYNTYLKKIRHVF